MRTGDRSLHPALPTQPDCRRASAEAPPQVLALVSERTVVPVGSICDGDGSAYPDLQALAS